MKRLIAFSIFTAALSSAAAPVRGGFALQDHLPKTTLVFLEIPDSGNFRIAFERGRLYEVVKNDEVQQFIRPAWKALLKQFESFAKEFEQAVGIPWDKAWELAHGQTALSVVSIEEKEGPDLVLSLDCAGNRATLLKAVQFLRDRYEKETGKKAQSWKIGEAEVLTGEISEKFAVHVAVLGDVLVATTRKSTMESIGTNLQTGAADPLSKSPLFQKARGRAELPGNGAGLLAYANLPGILDTVARHEGEREEKLFEGLGLRSLTYVAGAIVPEGDRVRESFHIGVSGERKGLAKLFSLKGAAPDFTHAPAGALEFASLSVDLADLWETAIGVFEVLDEYEHEGIVEGIRRFEREAGISIKDDLIPALGPRIYGSMVFPPEGLVPDGVTVYEIKDKERLDKCLRAIAKNLQAEWAAIEHQGKKIEYLRFHQATAEEVRGALGSVYFVRTDTRLIATGVASLLSGTGAGSPNALKRFLARSGGPTLADVPEVKAWVGGKTGGASAVLYADLERGFNVLYNTLAPIAGVFGGAAGAAGLPIDLVDLPLGETLAKSFSKTITFVESDDDGLAIRSVSGSGLTLMTAVYGGGVAAMAFPLIQAMEDKDRARRCGYTIENLSQATKLYEIDYGKYPPSGNAEWVKALTTPGPKKLAYYEFGPGDLNENAEVVDPWDRPFVYRNNQANFPKNQNDPDAHNKQGFDLYSFGPNGVDEKGEGDDVTNWK